MVIRVISYLEVTIFGGNWNNSVKCSSRGSNWNNSPLNLNENHSGRSFTDTQGSTLWLNLLSCSFLRQIHNKDVPELVKRLKTRGLV